ncbi:hypothetical protein BU15DRAFT_45763, partial [Melanogaster broomeanus]
RNVVVFGDSGVGKSSVINLLTPSPVAKTSSGASVCTFMSKCHNVIIDNEHFQIWDTAGLDGGSFRTPPPAGVDGGIQLLVYVVRGPSLDRSIAKNYVIFYTAISRKKIPIAVIITGLENVDGNMEDWWKEGQKVLADFEMYFDAHACVTTLSEEKTMNTVLDDRRRRSQTVLAQFDQENLSARRRAT